ncbi:MAG TPA: type I-U CRISPR-associated protein Csb2 [bacterium]|nr:type I-U CRISPR-associated protein Csb2 [bacterium]HQL64035.1 type I-U CRISPR-associated protein Csb2 [bacterium]
MMPVAIAFRFLSGRFHATPWGRHVNEGVPEWPPSPWRILRTLVATWKRKLPGIENAAVKEIIESLLEPPVFALPQATVSHTRHFMPLKRGPEDKTLIFDTFVSIERKAEVIAIWPGTNLRGEQADLLRLVLSNVGFFGRAESWCEARLLGQEEIDQLEERINCVPLNVSQPGSNQEIVRVLCADPETAFGNEYTPKMTIGKGKKKSESPLYDPDWHLCMETLEIHKQKWSDPPGAKWVSYIRQSDCFKPSPKRSVRRKQPRFQVARFVIDGPVLPLVEETLPFAELMRRSLMWRYSHLPGMESPCFSEIFSGKNIADGSPLEGHQHAYFLPADEDDDGRIDHITVVSDMCFGDGELRSLDRIRKLKWGEDELGLMLIALTTRDEAGGCLFGPSKVWESATPFLVTRHPKKRGQKRDSPELLSHPLDFVRQVLTEELDRYRRECRPDILEHCSIELLNENRIGAHHLRPIQFKRFRQKRGDDGGRCPAGGFRVTFPEPVRGPLCLGHSCHFGLGLFIAKSPDAEEK